MSNITKLTRAIRGFDTQEEAEMHLSKHINSLAERLIENAWNRSKHLMRFAAKNRKNQLGKFKLESDPYSDVISAIDFNRFYNAILVCLKDCSRTMPTKEVMDTVDAIETRMMEAKSGISTDGRSILPFEKL